MSTRPDRESEAIEDLRSYARSLADSVSPGRAEAVVARALAAGGRRDRAPRMVLALATAGLLAVSNVALATVADGAVPGDLLYPVDRGYEWVADLFGATDRTLERLAEAGVLSQQGSIDEAIELLRDELTAESSDVALLVTAIQGLENQAVRGNRGQASATTGDPGDPGPAAPALTAPGQVTDQGGEPASPSATAPGRQGNDGTEDSPSLTAPGQTKDATGKKDPFKKVATTSTTSPVNGSTQGNRGQGNNEP